jgi:hypothetical protein
LIDCASVLSSNPAGLAAFFSAIALSFLTICAPCVVWWVAPCVVGDHQRQCRQPAARAQPRLLDPRV